MALSNKLKISCAIIASFIVGILIGRTGISKRPAPLARRPQKAQVSRVCKVAIVLDDWGYSIHNTSSLFSIEEPITLSILPNLPYSGEISKEAQERGKEVILHMPMEPYNRDLGQEQGTLRTDMPREEVLSLLERGLASIVGEKGLSNHMGSKATENNALMRLVMQELEKRDLFFVDSLVTRRSVGAALARTNGVPSISRDVFLDNETEPEYIKKQLARLIRIARKQGYAVGIGHDKQATIEVLKGELPKYAKQDIKFVFVSELVK